METSLPGNNNIRFGLDDTAKCSSERIKKVFVNVFKNPCNVIGEMTRKIYNKFLCLHISICRDLRHISRLINLLKNLIRINPR